jgi:hypothetical protein
MSRVDLYYAILLAARPGILRHVRCKEAFRDRGLALQAVHW